MVIGTEQHHEWSALDFQFTNATEVVNRDLFDSHGATDSRRKKIKGTKSDQGLKGAKRGRAKRG